MIEIFTINLAANESREVALSGEYFELRNAVSTIALIELLDRSGGVVSRLANPEQSDYVRPGLFETVRVTNGPDAQIVKYFVGSGDAGSRRTSGTAKIEGVVQIQGVVSVNNPESTKADEGKCFTAHLFIEASGQFSALQLWNPIDSGVLLTVNQLNYGVQAPWNCQIGLKNQIIQNPVSSSIGVKRKNKQVSKAFAYKSNTCSVSQLGFSEAGYGLAGVGLIDFAGPYIIDPGYGLIFSAPVVGMFIGVDIEYYETQI